MREHIVQLLQALLSCNDDLYQITSGMRQDGSLQAYATDDLDVEFLLDDVPQSEADELTLNVADIVTNLMKVSALRRKATKRDRYERAFSANSQPILTEIDTRHVADKFPKVRAHRWLVERLGKAIVQRRQFLLYAREHRDRLAEVSLAALTLVLNHISLKAVADCPFTMLERPDQHATQALTDIGHCFRLAHGYR